MAAVDELVEALTEAGLSFGRPASRGLPEVRVRNVAGQEFTIRVSRFSFLVLKVGSFMAYQRLTVADVLDMIRNGRVE